MSRFPHLFSPARVGSLELPNRIVFAATSSELADHECFVTEDMIEFYAERARGGAALLNTGSPGRRRPRIPEVL
jgi:2,4-dienoyl-CoA reductase-like NADH-dependent reductase (Old Yellow Enzyme family)